MPVDYQALKNGGFLRQRQKNRFSLRVRVVGGHLTAAQLATIALAANKYGKGHVHLTSRQGVEIPFVKLRDVEAIRRDLAAGGVLPGFCGAGVRTVTACQGNAVCASGCIDTYQLAKKLDKRYQGRPLPHKFKIGVTGCPNNCLKAEENDLGVKGGVAVNWEGDGCVFCGACARVCRTNALAHEADRMVIHQEQCTHCGRCARICPKGCISAKSGYLLSFGGLFGNTISKGRQLLPLIHDQKAVLRIADTAVDFFQRHGSPGQRFKFAVDGASWEAFTAEILREYEGLCGENGGK